MKHKKQLLPLSTALFLLICLLLVACTTEKNMLPPANLDGHTLKLIFAQKSSKKAFDPITLSFKSDLTYTSKQNGHFYQEGSYTYNRMDASSAEIEITLRFPDGSGTDIIQLIFDTSSQGHFYSADLEGYKGHSHGEFVLN